MQNLFASISAIFSFNVADPAWSFWLNVVAVAVAVVGPPSIVPLLIHIFSKPRKRLSYYTESDAALIDQEKDLGEDMSVLLKGGALLRPTVVNEARLIMFKIVNTGSDIIRQDDFDYDQQRILRFEFQEPKLILCAVHHTEPEDLITAQSRKNAIHLDPLTKTTSVTSPLILPSSSGIKQHVVEQSFHRYVDLDGRILENGNAIILKFVTQGRIALNVKGRLLGGKIVKYVPSPPVFTVPRLLIGLLLTFLLVLVINPFGSFQRSSCALSFSTVNISGSSAFANTVSAQAGSYHQGCPFGVLNVQSSDSAAGLRQLENKNLDVANSEITPQEAGYNYHDLVEHQVAIITFTMVINKDVTGEHSLSQDDISRIYDGEYTNWNQVHGPDLPIVRIGRPSGSGTETTFQTYVLQPTANAAQPAASSLQNIKDCSGAIIDPQNIIRLSSTPEVIDKVGCVPGAIGYTDLGSADNAIGTIVPISINDLAPSHGLVVSGKYPFWAIERMYTRQDASNALTDAFIAYVTSHTPSGDTFVNIEDMPQSVRIMHK